MTDKTKPEDLEIRIGVPEDLDRLMEISMMACDENGFVNPDKEKLLSEIWQGLVRNHGIVGIIGKPGEQIEGAVLLRIGAMWYSHDLVAEEKAIFVHPDFRKGKVRHAQILCEFSKKVADELGIPLMIGVLSNHRTQAKVRLYERQFGPPSGAFFLYGAKTGDYHVTEH